MANTKSSKKSIRQIKRRTARNVVIKDAVRTARREMRKAIEGGDQAQIKDAFAKFTSTTDKAATRNVIHKNKASRLKSRMNATVKKAVLGAAASK